MSILNSLWPILFSKICSGLSIEGIQQGLIAFLIAIPLGIWQSGDMLLYARFGTSARMKLFGKVMFVIEALIVSVMIFFLGRIVLAKVPLIYHSLAASGLYIVPLAAGLICSKPMKSLERLLLTERVRLSYPPLPYSSNPRRRQFEQISVKLGRVITLRWALFFALAWTFIWQQCNDEINIQAALFTIRSLLQTIPRWAIMLPAYFLVIILPSVRPLVYNLAGIGTVISLVLLGHLAGVHWGWLVFPLWLTFSKIMHLSAALDYRRIEAWWSAFLTQHGFAATFAHRILASEPQNKINERANRLEFGGRIATLGKLPNEDGFILYEMAGESAYTSQQTEAYVDLAKEFFEAYLVAKRIKYSLHWFRYLLIRPSNLLLPVALEYRSGKFVCLHLHPKIQDELLAPGEIDVVAQEFAEDLKDSLILIDPPSFALDHEEWWKVTEVPELALVATYEQYHARFY